MPSPADRVVERVRAAIEDAAGAPTTLEVPHRPLWRHLWRRLVPTARVTFTDLPIADGRSSLAELVVDLTAIHLDGPRRRPDVHADAGTFRATLTADALNRLVTLPPGLSALELTDDGLRLRTVAGLAVDTDVELRPSAVRVTARGGVLRLLPTTGWTTPLPALPYGATIRRIETARGLARAHGDLDPDTLRWSAEDAA